MRMNKYVYHFVSFQYINHLILFLQVLCLNIKVLLLLQVKFTGWVNYLIPLRGLLSQGGCVPWEPCQFVYNVGSNL